MTHLVLARKYRPKSFKDVVGQDVVVATLKAAIEKNRVAHAMLFTGGRGIGKTTIARIVAKALVCLNRVGAEPCGSCAQCSAIDNFSSLDVVEIDGASHTGVDDIRDLRDSARYQPSSAKVKIFIIDEVHMLSISAFNALLKILEEPPAHVVFMFATTEAHKIPKTILSRCQRYDLRRMPVDTIFSTLKNVGKAEGFLMEDAALYLIAELADGGLRDALSMTEQILSNETKDYSAEAVARILGVVSHRAVKDICQALIDGEVAPALLIVKEVYEKGLDLCHLMDAMTERFRVLSLCAHVDRKSAQDIVATLDESDFDYANKHDKADLKRLFAMAIDGMSIVFSASKPLLALELFLLRAALRPPISDAATINFYLQKLDAIMHNRPLPKEPMAFKADHQIVAAKPTVAVAKPITTDTVELFGRVLSELAKTVPGLSSHLRHGRPDIDFDEKVLRLSFEQSLHYEQALPHSSNKTFLALLFSVFGCALKVVFELKKSPSPQKALPTVAEADQQKLKQEQEALYERARQNPLVKKALEIFGGDITEVRKVEKDLTSSAT